MLFRSGELFCWGKNTYGKVGDGTEEYRKDPVKIGTFSDWETVSTGEYHTCGIRLGKLYCWGYNSNGQLGDGTTENSSIPVLTSDESPWKTVTTGHTFSCGILKGKLYCWGNNNEGLGTGENWEELPVEISEPFE